MWFQIGLPKTASSELLPPGFLIGLVFQQNLNHSQRKEGGRLHQDHSVQLLGVFICQKFVITWHFDLIHWDRVWEAINIYPQMFHVLVTKLISHFCGNSKQLSCIDPEVENVCPYCKRHDKMTSHIKQYTKDRCVPMFDESLELLRNWIITWTTIWLNALQGFVMESREVSFPTWFINSKWLASKKIIVELFALEFSEVSFLLTRSPLKSLLA